jgi:hypothetical protein
MKKFLAGTAVGAFVGGAAATMLIGRMIKDEIPGIVSNKVTRGMNKILFGIESSVFGEQNVRPRPLVHTDYRYSSRYGKV